MFSSTTTELSIRREKASARPPSTMELMVPPPMLRARKAASAESGIDSKTATVAADAAEEDQDHERGQHQADAAFVPRFSMAVLTKTDWSKTTFVTSDLGTSSRSLTRVA